MKVYPITPRGYCKGVVRAIELAKKQAHQEVALQIYRDGTCVVPLVS